MVDRRTFLGQAGCLLATGLTSQAQSEPQMDSGQMMTVTGPIPTNSAGFMLPHEHLLVDFRGAALSGTGGYESAEVEAVVLPFLRQIYQAGVRTLVDCTPAYLGRDVHLLRSLSEQSGLYLLTNTGWYGAAGEKYLPERIAQLSVESLAEIWITESRDGIDHSGIRPGFIKIGMDGGALSPAASKLVRAAVLTSQQTGLTIASHTGDGLAAKQQIGIMNEADFPLDRWIWVHAQLERDMSLLLATAGQGAWIEFDGLSPETIDENVERLIHFKQAGLLNHLLISHDAGWYTVGEPNGGYFRGFDTLATLFLPALRQQGFSGEEVEMLTVTNPARAFQIRS